ncbi:MAG TPA: protein kinase, partial [Bryobacteraceae bacterium]|nr:protein kinase [Bryobacteraceae bacterium]
MDSGDLFFVATDPSEGVPLSDKSFRHAPPWFKLDLLRQVAGALQTLHEFGLLYPSLRTDSIVVVDGSTAKLLDVFEANPSSSVNPYTAPEVAAGAPRSPRSDVFALGVIAYELLCDTLPFIGTTEAELAHAILSTHPAPPSSVGVLGMDELIAKSLAKDPDERYESAAEFLAALPALASASPPQPIPLQPVPPAQRPLPELEEPFDVWDD